MEETILALQSQRDASAVATRELQATLAEVEGRCEALKAEKTQARARGGGEGEREREGEREGGADGVCEHIS